LGFKITSWSGDINKLMDTNMKGGAITILVAGFVIFIIAFLGCCGALKENSCMLSTYAGLILILVVLQCVGAYFAIKYKTDIEDKISEGITKEFKKFEDRQDNELGLFVQEFQKTFECCGIKDKNDFKNDPPASCCQDDFSKDDPWKTCPLGNVKFNTGCVEKVKDTVGSYLGGLAGVAIALVAIQIIIILSACCLSREVRD